VVAAAVLLTCVLFVPAAADPLNVVKLTALLLCALGLLFWALTGLMLTRTVTFSTSPTVISAAALLVALALATVTAPVTTTAVLGAYGRNSGLLAFSAALVLYFTVVLSGRTFDLRFVVGSVTAAGFFISVYGQLQVLGIDPIAWANPFNPIVATLGNSNFASAYMGVVVPVATGGAIWSGWSRKARVLCGITAAICLGVSLQSAAVQGPIAATAGLSVVAFAFLLEQPRTLRRIGLTIFALLAAFGATALAAGAAAQAGPAGSFFQGIAYQARLWYWEAAVRMLRDHPVLGVGLSHYGEFWRSTRPRASVAGLGDERYSDSAHNVFLQMFAQGGLVLGASYLAFVITVGVVLVQGLRRLDGPSRILLGSVGGGWAAFQMQSIVSIDQVPLITLHFVLAGALVVAAGAARPVVYRLKGAAAPPPSTSRSRKAGRRSQPTPQRREPTPLDLITISVVAVLALVAAAATFTPLRANIAVRTGDLQLARGLGNDALRSYERAAELVPGMAYHWMKQGDLLRRVEQPERALLAYTEATRRDPYAVSGFIGGAQTAETTGDLELSARLYERAVALDPWDERALLAAATFHLRHSGAQEARVLLEDAVVRLPEAADLWAALGDARAVLGNRRQAALAYGQALELEPGQKVASDGLSKLDAA
jgi:putative inorganic carbon (HCO3(-)) transporter